MEVALWHPGGSLRVESLRSVNLTSDILIVEQVNDKRTNEGPKTPIMKVQSLTSSTKREKKKRGMLTIFNGDVSIAT